MFDICCVGHITSDKVVNSRSVNYMPGGTALYFSHALSKMDTRYLLVTAVADAEMHYVDGLRQAGIKVEAYPSAHTVFFENIYADDQDQRTQNVLAKSDAFTVKQLADVDAKIFHLGPLLADDFSLDVIKSLAGRGRISLDVQGYLREVRDQKVYAVGWPEKIDALQYINIIKADVGELQALTGNTNVKEGAKILADWGPSEVVITNGSQGSMIYSDGVFYTIPAYPPAQIVDATGCGDTYMAGYVYQRVKGVAVEQAGHFAAAISGLKTAVPGPFSGTEDEVMKFMGSF